MLTILYIIGVILLAIIAMVVITGLIILWPVTLTIIILTALDARLIRSFFK